MDRGVDIYDHQQTASFNGILFKSLSLFKPLAEKVDVHLFDEVDQSIVVQADPDALVRIINNIIENAIKYTGAKGRISLTLSAEGNHAVFTVS